MTPPGGSAPTPFEVLSELAPSQGNIRNFLEQYAFAPVSEEAQREAGEASALAALAQAYDLTDTELVAGMTSVAGAQFAAGGLEHLSEPDPDVPQDPTAAAFFDVDNTFIQGASILHFAAGLAKRKFFTASEVAGFAWKQLKFRVTGTENMADVAEGRQQALSLIEGRNTEELVSLGEQIFDETMDSRIYEGAKELARMHVAAGQQVWLVTATPVQLAQVIARRLGLSGALGTVAEVKGDKFTGRLIGDILHGPGKKQAVAALAAAHGLDLVKCTAYSDSANDIPMLSMVGTAVAVNPDKQLRAYAKEHGWEIRDYRNKWAGPINAGITAALIAAGVGLYVAVKRSRSEQ